MPSSTVARSIAVALVLAASATTQAQSKPAAPPPAVPVTATAPAAAREESDSVKAMGTWALVVFNTQPFQFPNTGGAAPLPLTIYTMGLRRWTTEPLGPFRNWGFDLGVGLNYARSSVTQPQTGTLTTSDGPSTSGFGLHAGLPLAITLHKHAVFELVPEANLTWAKETIPPQAAGGDTTKYSGWAATVGARAGFEIFFGFIGIPQLAIEASLGAGLTYGNVTSTVGPIERSSRAWSITTQRGDEPWSIFTGAVAAMYHF